MPINTFEHVKAAYNHTLHMHKSAKIITLAQSTRTGGIRAMLDHLQSVIMPHSANAQQVEGVEIW